MDSLTSIVHPAAEPFWGSLWQALFVQGAGVLILFAGLSVGLGTQSVVLLVNRVTPLRFAINLALSAALYVASALLWMASIWLIGRYVFEKTVPFVQVVGAVSLAYVPLLFGALILLPYVGPAIGALLETWSLVAVLTAVAFVYQFSIWRSLACVALGWLLLQAVRRLLGRPAARLEGWLWTITTGRRDRVTLGDLPPLLGMPSQSPDTVEESR
jgi:hypothetical protein